MGRLLRVAILVLLVTWVGSLVAVIAASRRDNARPADAIVVLGAAQYVGRPSPVLRARLDHGVALWRKGLAPRLVLTGGMGEGDTTSEAAVSARYARKQGVPDSALVLETEGRTTRESLAAAAAFMKVRGGRRVILVSDPFHMLRLEMLARNYGLEPYTSPTRTSPIAANIGTNWSYLIAESVKVPWVAVFGG